MVRARGDAAVGACAEISKGFFNVQHISIRVGRFRLASRSRFQSPNRKGR